MASSPAERPIATPSTEAQPPITRLGKSSEALVFNPLSALSRTKNSLLKRALTKVLRNYERKKKTGKGKRDTARGHENTLFLISSCQSYTAATLSPCDLHNISLKQRGASYSQLQVRELNKNLEQTICYYNNLYHHEKAN